MNKKDTYALPLKDGNVMHVLIIDDSIIDIELTTGQILRYEDLKLTEQAEWSLRMDEAHAFSATLPGGATVRLNWKCELLEARLAESNDWIPKSQLGERTIAGLVNTIDFVWRERPWVIMGHNSSPMLPQHPLRPR